MTYYRTTVTIDILSSDPTDDVTSDGIYSIAYEVTQGSWSGLITDTECKAIDREELEQVCAEHHTDPTFFTEWEEENNDAR